MDGWKDRTTRRAWKRPGWKTASRQGAGRRCRVGRRPITCRPSGSWVVGAGAPRGRGRRRVGGRAAGSSGRNAHGGTGARSLKGCRRSGLTVTCREEGGGRATRWRPTRGELTKTSHVGTDISASGGGINLPPVYYYGQETVRNDPWPRCFSRLPLPRHVPRSGGCATPTGMNPRHVGLVPCQGACSNAGRFVKTNLPVSTQVFPQSPPWAPGSRPLTGRGRRKHRVANNQEMVGLAPRWATPPGPCCSDPTVSWSSPGSILPCPGLPAWWNARWDLSLDG